MTIIEVFADITCPFTHVGLRRITERRAEMGRDDVHLWVRSWPLEVVNGSPQDPAAMVDKVAALRRQIAPDLFTGFRPATFPPSTLQALALNAVAYQRDPALGERLALELRDLVWEQGVDTDAPHVLAELAGRNGLPAGPYDTTAVLAEHELGVARGVIGSPHFFTPTGSVFCPTLDIQRDDGGALLITLDVDAYDQFMADCFGPA